MSTTAMGSYLANRQMFHITDASGQAHVAFKVSVYATKHRIMAAAASRDNKCGACQFSLAAALFQSLKPMVTIDTMRGKH